jgi:hypothetical protein
MIGDSRLSLSLAAFEPSLAKPFAAQLCTGKRVIEEDSMSVL